MRNADEAVKLMITNFKRNNIRKKYNTLVKKGETVINAELFIEDNQDVDANSIDEGSEEDSEFEDGRSNMNN